MIKNIIGNTKYSKSDRAIIGMMMLCFGLSIGVFLYLTGDIGFQGDDWWIFGIPFWNSFPDSLIIYAKESKRPIEGFYWLTLYETFGLYEQAFLAGSLILLGLSCLMMTRCLLTAFPRSKEWAVMSGLLAFVITPLANLVYMLHTDNSRISCLFFWISVWFFQSWAREADKSFKLILPIVFYCLATLTYENCALLIFSVPFMVLPVFGRHGGSRSKMRFLIKLGLATMLSFMIFLSIRFIVFGGGAVGHKSLTPPLELAFSYLSVFIQYVVLPVQSIRFDPGSLLWACLYGLFSLMLLKWGSGGFLSSDERKDDVSPPDNFIWMILCSFSVFGLGMAPYLLAGYSPEVGFTSQSRIFSSAGFGAALIICLPLALLRGSKAMESAIKCSLAAFIFVNAFSQISLRSDWIQAKIHRDNITKSLLSNVPCVQDGANFLFLDLQYYLSNNAVVFQGVDGLNEWIKIVYGNRKVNAYFLYPFQEADRDMEKKASITRDGISARGSVMQGMLPLDRLILLERKADSLNTLRQISREEQKISAQWDGVEKIETNQDLIIKK